MSHLDDKQLEAALESKKNLLKEHGNALPDRGQKIVEHIESLEREKKRREMDEIIRSGAKPIVTQANVADDVSVADSQEGDEDFSEEMVSKLLDNFNQRLGDAELFILDTRTLKDQIRASIRCFKAVITKFGDVHSKIWGCGLLEEAPSVDSESEQLSCDQLRSSACKVFQFFRDKILKPLVETTFSDPVEARNVIGATMMECDWLIYQVMYQGFDCRDDHDGDDDK